ncbi:MAG TPA: calcium-binding protein [Planctomycetaceae bacterium]|nr:calcium-binding protein [Planctomycetaceae bacterium]
MNAATVNRIVGCGLEGNDTINISASLNIPVEFHGDAGNDTVFGGAGAGQLFGGAGDDKLTGRTGNETLRGEAGNDSLDGGAGNDLLLGGDGKDTLAGGAGRDVLIGGTGADSLSGGAGDDILIAGTTDFDTNNAALAAIVKEWTAATPYATRVANLHAGVGLNGSRLTADTVHHDSINIDTLFGGTESDWFFARSLTVNKDVMTDRVTTELLMEMLDEI